MSAIHVQVGQPVGASERTHVAPRGKQRPHRFASAQRHLIVVAQDGLATDAEKLLADQGWSLHYAARARDAGVLAGMYHAQVGLAVLAGRWDAARFADVRDGVRALPHLEWIGVLDEATLAHDAVKRFIVTCLRDFHLLPVDPSRLAAVVGHAGGLASLRQALRHPDLDRGGGAFGLLGASAAMRTLYADLGRIVSVDLPVLISGESGTGKELVARAIHSHSERSSGPLVTINCAAMPASLLQSELFGHEKGAFTGAEERRVGKLEAADKGVLLLDEIADLSLEGQATLLRVLEDKAVTPLGSTRPKQVDIRVVASTNIDLEERIRAGKFRHDLYFRLAVLRIHAPPLRERDDDIELLAQHFLRIAAEMHNTRVEELSTQALALLSGYDFPGNLRELRSWINRAVLACSGRVLREADLKKAVARRAESSICLSATVDDAEKAALERALARHLWNVTDAAKSLGVSRATLYRMMKRHGVSRAGRQIED